MPISITMVAVQTGARNPSEQLPVYIAHWLSITVQYQYTVSSLELPYSDLGIEIKGAKHF